MPTLIRSERQTLRAIQDHILMQRRRAGAAYTQLSTIGVMFHPENADPSLNLVTPHQGVAWTRGEDLRQGFQLLETRGRLPRMQYLRGLFPDAFSRQLVLYGLELESEVPVWLYSPIQGPFPSGEKPFGRLPNLDHQSLPLSLEEVKSKKAMANWLRVYRSASYGVEVTQIAAQEIDALQQEQKYDGSLFVLGYHHDNPIAALRILPGDTAAELIDPAIIWPWNGMGFEEALITFSVNQLLKDGIETIYMLGDSRHGTTLYLGLGFIQSTQLLTYVRSPKASGSENDE